MPSVDPTTLFEYGNVLMYNELNFDADEMRSLHTEYVNNLNVGQKNIYDEIMSAVNGEDGGFFLFTVMEAKGKHICGRHCHIKLDLRKRLF